MSGFLEMVLKNWTPDLDFTKLLGPKNGAKSRERRVTKGR